MNFNMKALVAAAVTAVASMTVSAGPVLDGLSGKLNWKLQGTTSEYSPTAYGNESTWGIGEITEIKTTSGNPKFTNGQGGDYLYYVIYGIADLSTAAGGFGTTNIYNVGCTGGTDCDGKIHLDIYRMSSPITDILGKKPSDRSGFGTFAGLTDVAGASLYLGLEFVAGKVTTDVVSTAANELLTTLFQNANADVLPTSGTGTFFAEAVSGSAKTKWDTNGFLGGAADFDANFTLKPNFEDAGGFCPTGAAASDCFYGLINDPVQSNAIPEPAGLALVGLALGGLALVRRRKQA